MKVKKILPIRKKKKTEEKKQDPIEITLDDNDILNIKINTFKEDKDTSFFFTVKSKNNIINSNFLREKQTKINLKNLEIDDGLYTLYFYKNNDLIKDYTVNFQKANTSDKIEFTFKENDFSFNGNDDDNETDYNKYEYTLINTILLILIVFYFDLKYEYLENNLFKYIKNIKIIWCIIIIIYIILFYKLNI